MCIYIPKEPRTLEFVGPILRTRFSGEIQKKPGFLQKNAGVNVTLCIVLLISCMHLSGFMCIFPGTA